MLPSLEDYIRQLFQAEGERLQVVGSNTTTRLHRLLKKRRSGSAGVRKKRSNPASAKPELEPPPGLPGKDPSSSCTTRQFPLLCSAQLLIPRQKRSLADVRCSDSRNSVIGKAINADHRYTAGFSLKNRMPSSAVSVLPSPAR